MGPANRGLEHEAPPPAAGCRHRCGQRTHQLEALSNGKYVSVRIVFKAESREQYDLAHQALRDHPEVKWTL